MSLRITKFLALIAAVAVVFGLVACGGDDKQQQTEDAQTLLKETFTSDKKVDSGKVKVALSVDTEGLKKVTQPIKLDLSGSFQNRGKNKLPEFDLALTAAAEGKTLSAGAVSTGDAGYLEFQGIDYKVDGKLFNQFKKGFEQSQAKSDTKEKQSLSSLGLKPEDWLSDPKIVGDTKVGDTDTTHISATVDVKAMLANISDALGKASGQLGKASGRKVPTSIPEKTQEEIVDAVNEATFDVYTGKSDKLLRKLTFTIDVDVPESQQKKANGLTSAKIDFDLELTDVNQPQTIEAPENAKPLSSLLRSLSGLSQGLQGGGTQ